MTTNPKIIQNLGSLPQHRLKNLCAQHARIWMGIINLSPKSFSVSSRDFAQSRLLSHVLKQAGTFVKEGAHILDIGAVPTNPSLENTLVDPQKELKVLYPVLSRLKKEFGSHVLISVDTYSPIVASALAHEGLIDIVNDVYGGRKTENNMTLIDVVAQFSLGYVLMHMSGTLDTLATNTIQNVPAYLESILQFFQERKEMLEKKSIHFCIFDPGIGAGRFGKNLEQNLAILSEEFIQKLSAFGFPILIGLSRKSFLGELYPTLLTPHSRDVVSKEWEKRCFEHGVQIIRTHKLKFC